MLQLPEIFQTLSSHFTKTLSWLSMLFIALMMEAVRTSETLVYSSETTRRYIPEGSHLQK
jgi:hypothetical protein